MEQMEVHVNEYGATAFKFYNVRYDYGEPFPWRMDDPQVAFSVFEKAQELRINLIGVHKGLPLEAMGTVSHNQTVVLRGFTLSPSTVAGVEFWISFIAIPFASLLFKL